LRIFASAALSARLFGDIITPALTRDAGSKAGEFLSQGNSYRILLVDQAGRLRREGLPMPEAVSEAGRRRLRPILVTTVTTVLAVSYRVRQARHAASCFHWAV
jgi:hypothetical protein